MGEVQKPSWRLGIVGVIVPSDSPQLYPCGPALRYELRGYHLTGRPGSRSRPDDLATLRVALSNAGAHVVSKPSSLGRAWLLQHGGFSLEPEAISVPYDWFNPLKTDRVALRTLGIDKQLTK